TFFTKYKFIQNGCSRYKYDSEDDHFKVFLEVVVESFEKKSLKVVSSGEHGGCPCDAAYDIIKTELLSIHIHDAGNDRRKGPDEGKETCKNDCTSSVLVIKFFGLVQVT